MRNFQILALGPRQASNTTSAIIGAIRARGMSVWSEVVDDGAPDAAALGCADAAVLVDPSPDAMLAGRPIPWAGLPRVLISSAWLRSEERVRLLDGGFDHILPVDCSPLVVAAIVERLVHRGTLSITRIRGGATLGER